MRHIRIQLLRREAGISKTFTELYLSEKERGEQAESTLVVDVQDINPSEAILRTTFWRAKPF